MSDLSLNAPALFNLTGRTAMVTGAGSGIGGAGGGGGGGADLCRLWRRGVGGHRRRAYRR